MTVYDEDGSLYKNPPAKTDGFLPVGRSDRQGWVFFAGGDSPVEEQKELKVSGAYESFSGDKWRHFC